MHRTLTRTSLFAIILLAGSPAIAQPAPADQPAAHQGRPDHQDRPAAKAREMAAKAIAFLRTKQDKSGGWGVNPKGPTFPAITGLVLQGMLLDDTLQPTDPALLAGEKFLLDKQQPDGGIYDKVLQNYNTAISLAALAEIKNPDAPTKVAIEKAQKFLLGLQFSEATGDRTPGDDASTPVTKDDPFYGGFGYGHHSRPDLSNTAFAIEALRVSGVPESDPAFQRALVFLQRCQMLDKAPDGSPVNDMDYAKGSTQGGFIYATGPSGDSKSIGQSNAGEIMESLDGPAGASVRFTLKAGPDGKPMKLSRDEVFKRIRASIDATTDLGHGFVPTTLFVLMGPTGNGKDANEFEARANASPERLSEVVRAAMGDVIAGEVEAATLEHASGLVRHRAYGSMTYAGLKSYLYAGLTPNDPRVLAAVDWLGHHYTLTENPGLGTDGQYYGYVMFAKALHARGLPTLPVTTPQGVEQRRWADDLVNQLATLQNDDGSFRPVDNRWLESDPVLITAYSLVALEHAMRGQ